MRKPLAKTVTITALAVATAVAVSVPAVPVAARPQAGPRPQFDLEGHRGSRGLRPENTLAAFAKALQVGVSTLELDTGVTEDGHVVVSHDRLVNPAICDDTAPAFPGDAEFPYAGRAIRSLTLAQLKTLDCGTPTPAIQPAEPVPGARMPTLAEVFGLVERYDARHVSFDIETKLDPTKPEETVDPATFAAKVIEVVEAHGVAARSDIQSFDWRTLVEARRIRPGLRLVALAQKPTIFPGTPWTAGVAIEAGAFDGSLARSARSIGADALSVRAGDITDDLITAAHRQGMRIVPWTVNTATEIGALIDRGVDGIITDYPDRARQAMAERGMRLPASFAAPFDVEGHRGARAHRPENTLQAFRYALDKGVDTLELDTGVTADGGVVVLHDRRINATHCTGDPALVGRLVRDLTLAQVRSLDCGRLDPAFPQQVDTTPGPDRIPTLDEVFALVRASGDEAVRLNIETKISPLVDDTVPYDMFTQKLVGAIEANGFEDRSMIQSFDWRTIILARRLNPRIDTVALVWQFAGADCDNLDDECSLEAVTDDPSVKSPWTADLDWWRYRDLGRLVHAAKADVVSANWQVHDPYQGTVASSDWYAKQDPAIFHGPTVAELQRRGLRVVPYTVNDEATMQRVIGLGVDGIISDDVDRLLLVARRNGLD